VGAPLAKFAATGSAASVKHDTAVNVV